MSAEMFEILGWILLIACGVAVVVGLNKTPHAPRVYSDDGQCRCGSHTHPGFICSRCGGEA